MQINVKVITRSSKNRILKEENSLKVYLTIIPEKGKANELLIKLLSDYFEISKSQIKIIKGEKSKNKIIELKETL